MVELTIVVAIIAVLASIIMPKMTGARDKAKLAGCKNNLKHTAIAIEMYANDSNGNYYPPAYGPSANFCFNDSCYLVTGKYISRGPRCPHLSPMINNQPFYWWSCYGKGMIYCATDCGLLTPRQPHPGLGQNYPNYQFGKGIRENN